MIPWSSLRRLSSFQPGYFAFNAAYIVLYYLLPLATGLVVRERFDRLSAGAPARADVAGLIALFLAIALDRDAGDRGAERGGARADRAAAGSVGARS
jgi:hypothetical protein